MSAKAERICVYVADEYARISTRYLQRILFPKRVGTLIFSPFFIAYVCLLKAVEYVMKIQ